LCEKWGYPFVLDEFRYHLTLGDPIESPCGPPPPRSLNLLDLLSSLLAGEETRSLTIDGLCLGRQASAGAPFAILAMSGLRPPGVAWETGASLGPFPAIQATLETGRGLPAARDPLGAYFPERAEASK
jgi:hypothetical protein